MTPARLMIAFGALAGLAAVAVAAADAHAVHDPAARALVETGLRMQGWHAIALAVCGVWAERPSRRPWLARLAGAAFALGMLAFCGDVYLLAAGGPHLGIAPAGGVALMLGWLLLAASALLA